MAIQPIRLFGDPVLRSRAIEVDRLRQGAAHARRRTSPTPCSTRPAPGSPRRRSASACGCSPGTSTARSATWSTRRSTCPRRSRTAPEGCLSLPELTYDCQRALSVVATRLRHVRRAGAHRGHRAARPGDPARDRPPRRGAVHRPARHRGPQGGDEGDPRVRVVRPRAADRQGLARTRTHGLGL